MRFLLVPFFFLFLLSETAAQYPANTTAVKLANAIMTRWTTTPVSGRVCIDKMTSKGWEYSNSIVLHGMEKVYNKVNQADYNAYLTYIKTYVDDYVDASGNIVPGEMAQNLDKIHPGLLLLFLYEKYQVSNPALATRYQTAATYLRNYLIGPTSTYPKTSEGGYWHKNNATYTDVMMLDGIYMAHPFLVKYGILFSDPVAVDVAAGQTVLLASHLHNTGNHLLYHAYDHAKVRTWANSSTGISYEVWSRGMGWYVMALVDILKYLPPAHPQFNTIKGILQDVAIGIQANQDPVTGLWYQVVNKPLGTPANYHETTGSAMFVYALKIAVDKGWISNSYLAVAQSGWNGVLSKVTTAGDGMPQVNDFAPAMGVQGTSSSNAYSAYVSIASVDCPGSVHPHGYAAVLMAASVMELTDLVTVPVKFIHTTINNFNGKNVLYWKCDEAGEVEYYSVEISYDGYSFSEKGKVVAQSLESYSWSELQGNNNTKVYYRLKAITISGKEFISPVLVTKSNINEAAISIFPNPVTGNRFTLNLNNFQTGNCTIAIFASTGVKMKEFQAAIINSGTTSIPVQLPASISKGEYFIKVEDPDKKQYAKMFFVK